MAFDHSACPHCRRLREELEEAREELRQIRAELLAEPEKVDELKQLLKIPRAQMVILNQLITQKHATRRALFEVTRPATYTHHMDLRDPKIVNVYVTRLRNVLKPYGIEIENLRGIGYRISEKAKETLQNLAKERATEAAQIPQPTKEEVTL